MAPTSTHLFILALAMSVGSALSRESLLAGLHALREVLNAHGGLPGTLGLRRSNPDADSDSGNCTNWSYDNTTIFPNGKFRHEHSFQDDYAGFYGERFVDKPYVVHYHSGPLKTLLPQRFEYCYVHDWGVMECQPCDGVKTYYVFHDQPQVGCLDVPQKIQDPITLQNGTLLEDLVGVWPGSATTTDNGTDARTDSVTTFNAWPLLQYFGGAPGMVTASRVRPLNATAELGFDEDQEDRDEWLYDYRFGNASTAVRFEHAFLRFDESGSLYEDIQGSFYWRSVAGDYLVQYRRNHTGFYSNVQTASIAVYRSVWVVTTPPNKVNDCNQDNKARDHLPSFSSDIL